MRANQVRPTQYPMPDVPNRFLRILGLGVKTHTDRIGTQRAAGMQKQAHLHTCSLLSSS